jgi:hypothetical protein
MDPHKPFAVVRLDSINEHGERVTSFELNHHRWVLAEVNTHRTASRNSASSRARPTKRRHENSPPGIVDLVREHPAKPLAWGRNQGGMQSFSELPGDAARACEQLWEAHALATADVIEQLATIGLHKQWTNRLAEPFLMHRIIFTVTDLDNFMALRADEEAQHEIRTLAYLMQEALDASTPTLLREGEWHLPLIRQEDREEAAERWPEDPQAALLKISAGRCARVSYLTHDGIRDLSKDIELHDSLLANGHMSPLEHPARPFSSGERSLIDQMRAVLDAAQAAGQEVPDWMQRQLGYAGNFCGWVQYRKTLPNEHDFTPLKVERDRRREEERKAKEASTA